MAADCTTGKPTSDAIIAAASTHSSRLLASKHRQGSQNSQEEDTELGGGEREPGTHIRLSTRGKLMEEETAPFLERPLTAHTGLEVSGTKTLSKLRAFTTHVFLSNATTCGATPGPAEHVRLLQSAVGAACAAGLCLPGFPPPPHPTASSPGTSAALGSVHTDDRPW